MTEISIRPCRMDEINTVLDIWKRSGAIPSITDTADALRRHLADQPGLLLVAIVGGNIAGTIMGGWDGWRGNIYRLAVLPQYRLRGIARTLVTVIIELLTELGARKISVLVEKTDAGTISFWEALHEAGFHHDARLVRYTKTTDDGGI